MKSGTCPKCGSTEILAELGIRGGQGHPLGCLLLRQHIQRKNVIRVELNTS